MGSQESPTQLSDLMVLPQSMNNNERHGGGEGSDF